MQLKDGVHNDMFPIRKVLMTPREIGNIIRDERKAQGLRQVELAAAANVGVRFLIELETGKSTAQLGKTLSVLLVLGIKISLKVPGGEA